MNARTTPREPASAGPRSAAGSSTSRSTPRSTGSGCGGAEAWLDDGGGEGGPDPSDLFATLQQVYRRIPAPTAKIKRPGKAPDLRVLVQIERSFSLLVLKYSRRDTQPPAPVPG